MKEHIKKETGIISEQNKSLRDYVLAIAEERDT